VERMKTESPPTPSVWMLRLHAAAKSPLSHFYPRPHPCQHRPIRVSYLNSVERSPTSSRYLVFVIWPTRLPMSARPSNFQFLFPIIGYLVLLSKLSPRRKILGPRRTLPVESTDRFEESERKRKVYSGRDSCVLWSPFLALALTWKGCHRSGDSSAASPRCRDFLFAASSFLFYFPPCTEDQRPAHLVLQISSTTKTGSYTCTLAAFLNGKISVFPSQPVEGKEPPRGSLLLFSRMEPPLQVAQKIWSASFDPATPRS